MLNGKIARLLRNDATADSLAMTQVELLKHEIVTLKQYHRKETEQLSNKIRELLKGRHAQLEQAASRVDRASAAIETFRDVAEDSPPIVIQDQSREGARVGSQSHENRSATYKAGYQPLREKSKDRAEECPPVLRELLVPTQLGMP